MVSANRLRSKEFDVCSGVPQSSVLGPLLFLQYINDINAEVKHSDCRFNADDTLLSIDATTGYDGLQNDVTLYEWSLRWGMSFNNDKCLHMQIGCESADIRIKLGDDVIPTSNVIKYLGVHIQSNLKWNTQITKLTAKSNRSLAETLLRLLLRLNS